MGDNIQGPANVLFPAYGIYADNLDALTVVPQGLTATVHVNSFPAFLPDDGTKTKLTIDASADTTSRKVTLGETVFGDNYYFSRTFFDDDPVTIYFNEPRLQSLTVNGGHGTSITQNFVPQGGNLFSIVTPAGIPTTVNTGLGSDVVHVGAHKHNGTAHRRRPGWPRPRDRRGLGRLLRSVPRPA